MVAAHEQLDAAIDALLQASEAFESGTMVTGYTLIVAGAQFDDDLEPDDDEQDTMSVQRAFTKRGQSPHLTRGILETFLDQVRAWGCGSDR